jgi:hypothetical protein
MEVMLLVQVKGDVNERVRGAEKSHLSVCAGGQKKSSLQAARCVVVSHAHDDDVLLFVCV